MLEFWHFRQKKFRPQMTYTKPTSYFPENEAGRLEKLREYQILDTHIEDTFDKIALLALQIFNTPTAFITFVDTDRVFLKSNLSQIPFTEVDRGESLSSLTILNDDVTYFNDINDIPFLADNSLVSLEAGVRKCIT